MSDWAPPPHAPTAYAVLSCMIHHAVDGVVRISHRTIADLCHISRGSVVFATDKMVLDGVLSKTLTGKVATYRILAPERVSGERTDTWPPERKAALAEWWPRSFASDLFEPINAIPGAPVTVAMIQSMADKMGLRHDKASALHRKPSGGRKRIARREAPKPLVKAPEATQTFSPRQAIFHGSPLVPKCAWRDCHRQREGTTWCADHAAALLLPADRVVDALEALA